MSTIGLQNEKKTAFRGRGGLLGGLLLLIVVAIAGVGLISAQLAARSGSDAVGDTPRAVWAAQEIDHYRYTLQVGCFCIRELTYPVVVEVAGGELLSLTYAEDGAPADPAFFERYTAVEKLFAVIDDAAAQEPALLDVIYDDALGVPLQINIDISELMADEELYLTISDFQALD